MVIKALPQYIFEMDTEAHGTLKVSQESIRLIDDINKILEDGDITGEEFAKKLLVMLARKPAKAEKEEEEKLIPLTDDDVDSIKEEELNDFSRKMVEQNSSLFKDNSKGKESTIELAQNDGEDQKDYLLRAYKEKYRRHNAWAAEVMKKSLGFASQSQLSGMVKSLLQDNLTRSAHLATSAKALEAETAAQPFVNVNSAQTLHHMRVPENPVHETNRINQETNQLIDGIISRIDRTLPIVSEAAELISSMNNTTIALLNEFGENARKTETYTKLVITLALLSAIASGFSIYITQKSSNNSALKTQSYYEDIYNGLGALSDGNATNFKELENAIEKASSTEIKNNTDANKELIKAINTLNQTLEDIRQAVSQKDAADAEKEN